MRRILVAAVLVALLARGAAAQSYYRDLDAGQPGRVEDARVLPRYALGVFMSPAQFEWLAGGTNRYRVEPKLAYGIAPLTELELRAPLVELKPPREAGSASVAGLAGLSLGLTRALNVETGNIPAVALSADVSLPIGALAASRSTYFVKGLATKSVGPVRLHFNTGIGTYAVGPSNSTSNACQPSGAVVPGDTLCATGPIVIYDVPCNRVPSSPRLGALATRMCMGRQPDSSATSPASPSTSGMRWFAGAGADRAFPLQSALAFAGIFAERFVGLYPLVDWTAEVGVRKQLTPIVVVNMGVGRHFAGAVPSTFISAGASFEVATPWARP